MSGGGVSRDRQSLATFKKSREYVDVDVRRSQISFSLCVRCLHFCVVLLSSFFSWLSPQGFPMGSAVSAAALPPSICVVSCFAASIVRLRPTSLVGPFLLSLRPLASSLALQNRSSLPVFVPDHRCRSRYLPSRAGCLWSCLRRILRRVVLQCAAPSWRFLLVRSRSRVAMSLLLTFPIFLCADDSKNLMDRLVAAAGGCVYAPGKETDWRPLHHIPHI